MSKKLNNKEIAKIARRYARGETMKQLAKDYGVSTATILRKLPIEVRNKKVVSDTDRVKILALNKSGTSCTELAALFGYPIRLIHDIEGIDKKAGLKKRLLSQGTKDEIVHLYKAGDSFHKIAEKLGVAYTSVGNVIKVQGIARASGRPKIATKDHPLAFAILKRREQGESIDHIRKELHLGYRVVAGIVGDLNVTAKNFNYRLLPAAGEIVKRYSEGVSVESLAKTYGCSEAEILAIIPKGTPHTEEAKTLTSAEVRTLIGDGSQSKAPNPTDEAVAEAVKIADTNPLKVEDSPATIEELKMVEPEPQKEEPNVVKVIEERYYTNFDRVMFVLGVFLAFGSLMFKLSSFAFYPMLIGGLVILAIGAIPSGATIKLVEQKPDKKTEKCGCGCGHC